ncbi:cytochrome c-type biogenesis protein CcmH [Lacticaseibacillus parakribbianus]|uniref:cytochrome c-type biogenesis protein CcmH n=1 Tax=Lacticaseibacillus parakribbianus TaxID=2970927 RepID=UPI0021CB13ED|nr:cytochrome c-type biogenesis protein CcmH [Lacticaseibacillus parakribbianus]
MKRGTRAALVALVALVATVVGLAWRPQPVAAATAPLQTAIVKNATANGYDLILKNNSNRDYRNVRVTATLPKALAGQSGKLTWRIKRFGLSGQRRLAFTVAPGSGKVTVAEPGATVHYAGHATWWLAAGAFVVVLGAGGAFWLLRRRRAATAIVLIGLTGGGLALVLNRPVTATESMHSQVRFTRDGKVYAVATQIRYDTVAKTVLVPFTARVSGDKLARVTVSDRDAATKRTVPLQNGVLATRLVKSHRYRISGAGLDANLTPGGRNTYKVKAATGKLRLGQALTKNGGTLVLKTTAAALQTTAGYRIDPAHARVIVNDTTADYRVGDCLYLPPFGYNYGGAAVRVTGVAVQATQTVLTVTDAKVDAVVATVDAPPTTVSADQAVFVPAPGVTVSGQPAQGVGLEHTGWSHAGTVFDAQAKVVEAQKFSFEYKYPNKKAAKAATKDKKDGDDDSDTGFSVSDEMAASGEVNFSVHTNFITHKTKTKLADTVTFGNTIEVKLAGDTKDAPKDSFFGSLAEGLPVGTLRFPTPVWGVSVELPVNLVLDLSGELTGTYKFEIARNGSLTFQTGKKFKHQSKTDITSSGKVEAKGTAQLGFRAKTKLMILQSVSPADLDAFAGLQFEADGTFTFAKGKVVPHFALAAAGSIEGDVLLTGKAESELPMLWHGKKVESKELEFKYQLFKLDGKTGTKKKATADKADKTASNADGLTKQLVGKSFQMMPEQFDGEPFAKAYAEDRAPYTLNVYWPFGYFLDDHQMRVGWLGRNAMVENEPYTISGNTLHFEDWDVPFKIVNGQITFGNFNWTWHWTGDDKYAGDHKMVLSFTLGDDAAEFKKYPGF